MLLQIIAGRQLGLMGRLPSAKDQSDLRILGLPLDMWKNFPICSTSFYQKKKQLCGVLPSKDFCF